MGLERIDISSSAVGGRSSDTRLSELRQQAAEIEAVLEGEEQEQEGQELEALDDEQRAELMERLGEVRLRNFALLSGSDVAFFLCGSVAARLQLLQ